MLTYFKNIVDSLRTTVKGMQVTFKNLRRPETTVSYPEELLPMPKGYRGFHTLDQETCIYCFQCARICPVECIEMKADRVEKKFLAWEQFSVDYNKCLFCNLCIEVCPKDCIHMDRRDGSAKFALITDDRSTLNVDLLLYAGLSETDQKAVAKIAADRAAGIETPPAKPAAGAAKPAEGAAKPEAGAAKAAEGAEKPAEAPSKAAEAKPAAAKPAAVKPAAAADAKSADPEAPPAPETHEA